MGRPPEERTPKEHPEVAMFVRLDNIVVSEPLGEDLSVTGQVGISNDPRIAMAVAEPIREIAGAGVCDELRESVFLYAMPTPAKGRLWDLPVVAKNGLSLAALLSHFLWLTRDNSLNADYVWAWRRSGLVGTVMAHTNRHLTYWLDTRGQYGPVEVSKSDLMSTIDYMNREVRVGDTTLAQFDLNLANPDEALPAKDSRRMERAWFLLQAMRTQCHLPSRVAGQCTVMEALVSTDTSGIAHKVAERVARLLENTPEERAKVYDLVKSAYAIRSSHVHGGTPKSSGEGLEAVSRDTEALVRRLIARSMQNEPFSNALNLSNPALDKWFTELVLE